MSLPLAIRMLHAVCSLMFLISEAPAPCDPLLAYKKTDLVTRVRKAEELLKAREKQHDTLLQDYVQKDIKIAELEAELARHRQYLEGLRLTMQRQEHQGP